MKNKKTYTCELNFYDTNDAGEPTGDPMEYRALKRSSIEDAKSAFGNVLRVAAELEGWATGALVYVDAVVVDDESMTYADGDSCYVRIKCAERTNEPSLHVDWSKSSAKPHIFSIDRNTFAWEIVEA